MERRRKGIVEVLRGDAAEVSLHKIAFVDKCRLCFKMRCCMPVSVVPLRAFSSRPCRVVGGTRSTAWVSQSILRVRHLIRLFMQISIDEGNCKVHFEW
jgi:hypothetical protein